MARQRRGRRARPGRAPRMKSPRCARAGGPGGVGGSGRGGGVSPAALDGAGAALGNSGHPSASRGRLGPGLPPLSRDGGGGRTGGRSRAQTPLGAEGPGSAAVPGAGAGLRPQPGRAAPLRGAPGEDERSRGIKAPCAGVCGGVRVRGRCSAAPARSAAAPPPRVSPRSCPSGRRGWLSGHGPLSPLVVVPPQPSPRLHPPPALPSPAPQVRETAAVRG